MRSLAKKYHAVISLLILVLLLVIIFVVIIEPALVKKEQQKEAIETLVFEHQRLKNAKKQIDELQEQIALLQKKSLHNKVFSQTATPAIIAADTQAKIKALIERNQGNLISTNVLTGADSTELFKSITVKVRMQCDIKAFRAILYQLASDTLLFSIDQLTIKSSAAFRINKNRPAPMDVSLSISSYAQNK